MDDTPATTVPISLLTPSLTQRTVTGEREGGNNCVRTKTSPSLLWLTFVHKEVRGKMSLHW